MLDDSFGPLQAEAVHAVVPAGIGAHLSRRLAPKGIGRWTISGRAAGGARGRSPAPSSARAAGGVAPAASRSRLALRSASETCGVEVAVAPAARSAARCASMPLPATGPTASSAAAIVAGRRMLRSRRRRAAAARGAQPVLGGEERALGPVAARWSAGVVEDLGDVALEVAALVRGDAVPQVAVVVERALEGLHEQVLDFGPAGSVCVTDRSRAAVSAACRLATTWSMPARAASG